MAYKGTTKYPDFGKNLRNLRKSKNLTQKELAKELDVSAQSITAWETSQADPRKELLEMLADYFDIDIDMLRYAKIDGLSDAGSVIYHNFLESKCKMTYKEYLNDPGHVEYMQLILANCRLMREEELNLLYSISGIFCRSALTEEGFTQEQQWEMKFMAQSKTQLSYTDFDVLPNEQEE